MRPLVRLTRVIAGAGAWTMVAPPILLAGWAAVYLWDVFEYATAPGIPVAFEYEGQRGMVKVRAQSYAADVRSRTVLAKNLEIIGPDGQRILNVNRALVTQDQNGLTKVEVIGVDALLDRAPNGEFSFFDSIPKPPEERGPETPIALVARDVSIRYRDRTRTQVLNLSGKADMITANSVGNAWLAEGALRFDQIGKLPFEVVLGDEGALRADFNLAGTEIVPLLPVIERYLAKDETLPFRARSMKGSGLLQLDSTPGQPFRAFGSLKVGALDFASGGYRAESLTASIELFGQRVTGRGFASGSGLSSQVDQFSADWSRDIRLNASGTVQLRDLRKLPREWTKNIPADARVTDGEFRGKFGLDGDQWLTSGVVSAQEIRIAGERISAPKLDLVATPKSVAARVSSARWQGVPFSGAINASLMNGTVNGFAQSKSVELGPIVNKYNLPLTGRGTLQLVAESKGSKQDIWIGSEGTARYRLPEGQTIGGKYVARLSGTPERLTVQQATVQGPDGSIAATGTLNLLRQSLDLAVTGGDIDAQSFSADVSGKAFFEGTVAGSFANPQFESKVDVFKLKVAETELPWLQLQARGTPNRIEFTDVEAQYGFSRLYGAVVLTPRTGAVSGSFRSPGVQLAEFGEGQAAGLVRILNGTVAGTLANPRVTADLEGGPISFSGATLSGITGRINASRDLISLANGKLSITDLEQSGDLAVSAQFRPESKTGNVQAQWDGVPLRPLAQFDERFAVNGLSSGNASVTFNSKGVLDGQIAGTFADVALNGQTLGAGPFELVAKNGEWSATGSIGSIDQYASLDALKRDASGNLSGRITSYQVKAESLMRLTRERWKDAPEEVQRFVADLTGVVDGTLAFGLQNDIFSLQTDDLRVSDLSVGGRTIGDLSAKISRDGSAWTLNEVLLQNGPERLSGKGRLVDDGEIEFEGEANKIGLSWLNAVNPDLAVIPAVADASFLVSGKTENPTVQASLKVSGLARENDPSLPPSLNLGYIELKDKVLVADGAFQAEGFTGTLNFTSPLAALLAAGPDGRAAGESFRLEATVAERQLTEFKDLLTGVDFDRSSGSIGGRITATGNVDQPVLDGGLRFGGSATTPARLAFKDAKTVLENPLLTIALQNNEVGLLATGQSSAGGGFEIRAQSPAELPGNDLNAWLARTPIRGSVLLSSFRVDEGDPSKSNVIQTALSTLSKETNQAAPIEISGNLNAPLIAGKVAFSDANADLPEFKPGEGTFTPIIDPRFDIDYVSQGPVRIRTLAASLVASAQGAVQGSLTRPGATGTFVVRDGTLKLPNARIQLEDGGLVSLLMRTDSQGETTVEVPVSLTGRTTVSARGTSSTYQRYDITIQVNGDLMQQGDLQLIGRSDPPDLSQQEILAIIGQRDLLEALATGAQNTRSEEFRNALIGLFLPSLSDQLTSSLATAFQLDYLALDYNPFEGAVLSGAKSFNKFLTLEGRRAVAPSRFVNAINYELRLVYRIPTKNNLLNRARFVLSTDNLRPYRIAIEYSIKL